MISFMDGSGNVTIIGNLSEWREFLQNIKEALERGLVDEKRLLREADAVKLN